MSPATKVEEDAGWVVEGDWLLVEELEESDGIEVENSDPGLLVNVSCDVDEVIGPAVVTTLDASSPNDDEVGVCEQAGSRKQKLENAISSLIRGLNDRLLSPDEIAR